MQEVTVGEFYSPPPTGGLYHKDLMQQSNIVTHFNQKQNQKLKTASYLADPTSPIPSHCAVYILFQSVSVHQLS